MDQVMAIRKIQNMLHEAMDNCSDEALSRRLSQIDDELGYFLQKDIDFKEIVDGLDDSIFITDNKGEVIYVNPAYTKNTGITPDRVLHHNVHDLIHKDKIYSGGAIPAVLESEKSVFRLSTTYGTGQPLKGFVSGTPIFDDSGRLRQVVACSRPIVSLTSLKNDFNTFLEAVNDLKPRSFVKDSAKDLAPDMIGKDTTLADIWSLIDRVAPSDATVMITGESGVGKEVIADEIYKHSRRCHQPFLKINCAAIPAQLLESELFGYEKGAFSGASTKGKAGLFEMANNGTLLLDEIGDMPMDLQVKLLRAIQTKEITRIGGTKPIKLDIRFLALTNSDLKEKIRQGTFRQDLYYRLNVIPIQVPPLRKRIADFPALCDYFIRIFSEKYNCSFTLTAGQTEYMKQYSWPGNIRELENIIEYLVLCSAGIGSVDDSVVTNLLNISGQQENISADGAVSDSGNSEQAAVGAVSAAVETDALLQDTDLSTAVARYEKQLLEDTLKNSANLREAGKKLGINASTISRKIKQYNIDYVNKKETH